jgi:acetyltransferase-like isoleucine patch superfamily enzyme
MFSQQSIVETDQIGSNVAIKEFVVIRKNVIVGDDVVIHPFVVIEEGVKIGRGVEIFPGSYIGKTPKGAGATARSIQFDPVVDLGDGCSIGPNAVIFYDVIVGHNTLVGDGASIREGCRIGSMCIVGRYVTLNYETQVGDNVKIMDHSWMAGKMRIGNNVFISGGVMTANDRYMGARDYQEDEIIGPEIREGARIGAGAILLPKLIIGENAVVAAGSVVTKNISADTLVMGIPARFAINLPRLDV